MVNESSFLKRRTDLTSVELRDALPALRGCGETLRGLMRWTGAARGHILRYPTRRAGVAGLVESGGLLLQSRHQCWVLGVHGLCAGQNLLPPKVTVMFLTSHLLCFHHCPWRQLGSQHCSPDALRTDCSTYAGAHLSAPKNSGVVRCR